MGTWGTGPFDSDHAGEFGHEVQLARSERRFAVIEERLTRFIAEAEPDCLLQGEAVAAAALVASQCAGGPSSTAPYWPRKKIPELPAHLRPLAATALDKVLADVQAAMDAWCERGLGEEWLEGVEALRVVLDPDTPYTVGYTPPPPLPTEVGTRMVHLTLGVDRIRALPGGGSTGPLGLLVRQINRAAVRLDEAQKDVQNAEEYSLKEVDVFRQRLRNVPEDGRSEFRLGDVPAITAPGTLGPALAVRAERHAHLQGLIDLYQLLSVPPPIHVRAAAAQTRITTLASRAAGSPTAATAPRSTPPGTTRRR
ncbi:DUF4259 domain-containing protein [Kitasatospora sp. NPDC059795]|uniref:DUF4259 domain-containing protein n=1 Tax=Kitasatospora sp. NPDC059795 TaxID=3346949 RepID=UPI00365E92E8